MANVEGGEECASVEGSGIMREDSEANAGVEAQCVPESGGHADIAGKAADVYFLYAERIDDAIHISSAFTALEDGIFVFVKAFPFV